MIRLNLPSFDYKLKKTGEKIFIYDIIRKKYVVLAPEEWVRQHFIHYMINHLNYPRTLINVETGLIFNQLKKRSDIIVYARTGNPWLAIECKSPDQPINKKVLQQISVYNSSLNAHYIALTNGIRHICCRVDVAGKTIRTINQFPAYSEENFLEG